MKFENINKKLFKGYTFIYFANDVYQGTGPEFFLDNYNIVTFDYNPLVDLVRQKTNVFTVEEATGVKNETFRNSYNLTQFPSVIDYVNSLPNKKKILIFKNSAAIMSASEENNWELCASPPELGRYFENKLKSTVYFKKLGLPIPKTKILKANEKNIKYLPLTHEFGEKFVIQLAKGFGGSHTFIINNENDLKDILPRISGREIKIMEFIQGKTITINACVTSKGVIASSPFLQITGIAECTKNKAGATGNEWNHESIPRDFVKKTTRMVGEFMKEQGYRGIFGLDIIITESGNVYFIENNARIINSIPFFTQLQIEKNELPLSYIHLLEYTEKLDTIDFESLVEKYGDDLKGAQIILHNLEGKPLKIKKEMKPGIYKFVDNTLAFLHPSYRVMDCKNPDEFLILPKELDRVINPDMETGRIQSPYRLVNNDGSLLINTKNLVNTVYNTLIGDKKNQ